MKKRGCTDVLCLLIFLAYVGGMVVVFVMAVAAYGDPFRLFYGYDVKGDTCGRKNDQLDIYPNSGQDLSDKKYLYFDITRTGILRMDDLPDLAKDLGLGPYQGDDKIGFCLNGNITEYVKNKTAESNNTANAADAADATEATNTGNSTEETFTEGFLKTGGDPLNAILTGGDSCRYCLEQCPADQ